MPDYRYLIASLVCCLYLLAAPNAEAGDYAFPVLGAPFRVTARVVTIPRKMQVNSLERRACRGNRMAAARVEGVSSRKSSRARARCGC
jgi:hypothetical protein